jgi:carbon monoxide dehydrogenase subunit G
MVHFEGVEPIPHPPAAVFAKLSDAGWLAQALPEVEIIETGQDRAVWKVRPKFAFMAGTLDTTAEVLERAEPVVRYRVTSTSVGAKSTMEATLTMKPSESGTSVEWRSDLTELGGLLKLVPRGLIQAAAQKVIVDIWAAIRGKMAV